ncbi:putative toxin-antitoxin system toxin component, PIN family [Flavisolibacter sp. BT320]|nr:putative toxin-antitoxin system toxin component, PIN family [Flavisolibacter longurius]
MNVVLDTNVLLVSFSMRSRSRWLIESFLAGRFTLSVTSEIIHEYEEKFCEHWNQLAAENVIRTILESPHTQFINIYFKFNLLPDEDDNKFADCAIASNADYLITEDRDFTILKTISFPKVHIRTLSEFEQVLENQR